MKRTVLAILLLATILCSTTVLAQCPPSCPLPGGGPAERDCHAEFAAPHVRLNFPPFDPNNPAPRTELRCFDGDPGCDTDGRVDGTCTFDLDVCLHNADPALAGCTPAPVTGVTFADTADPDVAAAQTAVNALLPATANVCTTGQVLHVPLTVGPTGRRAATASHIALAAVTDGGGTDDDSLDLTCVPHGWPSHGYSNTNHRASPSETVLTPDNAATLTVKWHLDISGMMPGLGAVTSTPTVGFGLVFVTGWNGFVYALHEENAEVAWSFQVTPTFAIGSQSSATLTADGRVLVGDADGTVYCLDALSGRLLWKQPLSIPFEGQGTDHIWGSPTVANNRVFVGIASHTDQPCTRGRLVALDLDTGAVLWDLPTIPLRICDNDTSRTCTDDTECDGGTCIRGRGAGVTATPAVDATGETVYMNTVGCYTYPSIGDSDSMFRIDAADGNVVWKHRVQPPEQFNACSDTGAECRGPADCEGGAECARKRAWHDFGFLNGPMIIEADDSAGGTRTLIVSGSKDGTLYAFDPADGSPVWTNEVAPTPVTPGFAGYGLFNGAIGFANQRIHAALYQMVSSTGNPPNHLRAFSSVDGHELWHDEIGSSWSHVGVANDLLFVGTQDTMQRCSTDLQKECTEDNECAGGHCANASPYFIYDARDGRRLKTLVLPANGVGGPSIVDGSVYIPYGVLGGDGGVIAYALPACLGDCNRNGIVTVDELVTGVNIGLNASPINRCYALDRDGSRSVQIDELIEGARHALEGCSA